MLLTCRSDLATTIVLMATTIVFENARPGSRASVLATTFVLPARASVLATTIVIMENLLYSRHSTFAIILLSCLSPSALRRRRFSWS